MAIALLEMRIALPLGDGNSVVIEPGEAVNLDNLFRVFEPETPTDVQSPCLEVA
jgi:hypothetical protein